jgi:C4-dicarboxylate transporter DctQ subunit
MNRVIAKVDHGLCHLEKTVLICGILLLAINSVANAVGRYFFSNSIYFSEELNSMLMISITFFGLGYVTRQGRHIRMSAVYDILGKRAQKIMMIIICASTCAIMFLLAFYSYEYVMKTFQRGRVFPSLSVPVYLVYILIVVGFITTGLQYLFAVVRNLDFSDENVYLSYTAEDVYEDADIEEVNDSVEDEPKGG